MRYSSYYEVRLAGQPRFSSVFLPDVESFARMLYRETGELPEIYEIEK